MRYSIDKKANIPAYLQIYIQIRDDITKEIYPYNTKLPSKRVLADNVGVSTITVEHAYALLCDEGYIEARERSGYFVIFRIDDDFSSSHISNKPNPYNKNIYEQLSLEEKLITAGLLLSTNENKDNFISNNTITTLSSNSSEAFPISVLAKKMRLVINSYGTSILDKSPNSGCIELRKAIQNYLIRSRGIDADIEQIIIGSGSEYLYTLIVELLGRNNIYAIEDPSYKKIEQVYKACDVIIEKLPLGNDGIDSIHLRESKANILHISPYRSYPSGVTATASKRNEYLRWANANNRFIIEDDFESEFSISKKREETLFSHSLSDNIIYMNTFSKTISPALRTGYMVLPKCLVSEFNKKLGFYSCTVPTYVQYVLAEIISNGDFERHINRVRRLKRKELNKNS